MKTILTFALVLHFSFLYGQEQQIQLPDRQYVYYSFGVGPSTITGLSFLNEIGLSHRKNSFSIIADLHQQLFEKSQDHHMHDFMFYLGLKYGRTIIKKGYFFRLNGGPLFYIFNDEVTTSHNWFGSATQGYGFREYEGFGAIAQVDFGKQNTKKTTIDFSAFAIMNSRLPILGVAIRINFKSKPKILPVKD